MIRKITKNNRYIVGKDLHRIRIYARLTTHNLALALNLKSHKTIVNWETNRSQPNINQFLIICRTAGVYPHKIIAAIRKRNQEDPTQTCGINLRACSVKGAD